MDLNLTTQRLTNPSRTVVSDDIGILATLTDGSKTVAVRGPLRTFTEQKRVFTDNFSRTFSNGWGQSPGGGTWLNPHGTRSKFSVNGSQGVILMDVVGICRQASLNDDDVGDFVGQGKFTVDELPTGASCSVAMSFGYQDSTNQNRARLLINTTGTVQLALEKEVAGVVTKLGVLTTVGIGFVGGDSWWIKTQRDGDVIRAKAWKDGNPEPGSFLFSVTDTTFMTGRLGVRSIAATGNTNIPYNVLVDDYQMLSGSWTNPPVVSHTTWVRTLPQAFDGNFTDVIKDLVSNWSIDTSDDVLAYAMKFEAYTPAVIDPILGYQVFGQSGYGPLADDGTRIEASDFNDYFGVGWTFPNGESTTFPHVKINQTLNMDCSGFVRMVYGRRMGIPMCFHKNFDGINLPRRTKNIGPSGPGILVEDSPSTPPPLDKIQIGDVVLFDADAGEPTEGQIDHNGIFLGVDGNGNYRFISSRKTANGPTFADLGGQSTIDLPSGSTYSSRLRKIRRF